MVESDRKGFLPFGWWPVPRQRSDSPGSAPLTGASFRHGEVMESKEDVAKLAMELNPVRAECLRTFRSGVRKLNSVVGLLRIIAIACVLHEL